MPSPSLVHTIKNCLSRMSPEQCHAATCAFTVSLMHLAEKYDVSLTQGQRTSISFCVRLLKRGQFGEAFSNACAMFRNYHYANEAFYASAHPHNEETTACGIALAVESAIDKGIPEEQVQALIALHLT